MDHKNKIFEDEINNYIHQNKTKFISLQKVNNLQEIIKVKEIERIIKNLDISKAPDLEKINNKLLKKRKDSLSPYLQYFFNLCLNYGIYPLIFKIAKIIMLHKPGKPSDLPSSYRPLSLTSCLGKILEKWVADHLSDWAEKENKFSPQQNGFRKNRNTNDNLFKLVQTIKYGFTKTKKQQQYF